MTLCKGARICSRVAESFMRLPSVLNDLKPVVAVIEPVDGGDYSKSFIPSVP
jgi:hypothetical protein